MLFFFRKAKVPAGSNLSISVTGNTAMVGLHGTYSVDGGPSIRLDVTRPLPLHSPHIYSVDFDVEALQAAAVTINADVITPAGGVLGTPFSQAINAQPGDLNTLHCDLTMQP